MKKKKGNPEQPVKLELGYADRTKLMHFPWPYKTASIQELSIVDVLPFIPGKDRAYFMDEVYRVLVPKGQATLVMVYYSSMAAFSDFRVEWPPLNEASFCYFNREWRKINQVELVMECDFDFSYAYMFPPEVAARAQEYQAEKVKTSLNSVSRLQVVLTKRE